MAHQVQSMLSPKPKRLIFTPIEQTYIQELVRITTQVRMRKDEKKWASRIRLVGLLELQSKTLRHDQLVEFFNTYHIKGKIIYARMGKKIVATNKHLIVNVLKISNKGWKKQKHAYKQTTQAMFQHIALLRAYVNTK